MSYTYIYIYIYTFIHTYIYTYIVYHISLSLYIYIYTCSGRGFFPCETLRARSVVAGEGGVKAWGIRGPGDDFSPGLCPDTARKPRRGGGLVGRKDETPPSQALKCHKSLAFCSSLCLMRVFRHMVVTCSHESLLWEIAALSWAAAAAFRARAHAHHVAPLRPPSWPTARSGEG